MENLKIKLECGHNGFYNVPCEICKEQSKTFPLEITDEIIPIGDKLTVEVGQFLESQGSLVEYEKTEKGLVLTATSKKKKSITKPYKIRFTPKKIGLVHDTIEEKTDVLKDIVKTHGANILKLVLQEPYFNKYFNEEQDTIRGATGIFLRKKKFRIICTVIIGTIVLLINQLGIPLA